MAFIFNPGDILGPGDLYIVFRDIQGRPRDVYDVTYSIYDYTDEVNLILVAGDLTPVRTDVGQHYAPYQIPNDANIGEHRIHWQFRETPTGPFILEKQRYNVISCVVATTGGQLTDREIYYIHELRKLLRDNDPDRNYRTQPPRAEEEIQGFTENYGYIWTDDELHNYLVWAKSDINAYPVITNYTFENWPDNWLGILLVRGGIYALRALAINWAGEEFDYSISGVSLSIDKSSKYMAMKENLETDYEKNIEEIKKNSIVILRGLQQPRYTVGYRGGKVHGTTSSFADYMTRKIIKKK